jgi:hypothetical protein
MALAHCILGKFLEVSFHYFPPHLDVPIFVARCLHVHNDVRFPSSERWNCGREMLSGNFAKMTTYMPFRDLLHAANPNGNWNIEQKFDKNISQIPLNKYCHH